MPTDVQRKLPRDLFCGSGCLATPSPCRPTLRIEKKIRQSMKRRPERDLLYNIPRPPLPFRGLGAGGGGCYVLSRGLGGERLPNKFPVVGRWEVAPEGWPKLTVHGICRRKSARTEELANSFGGRAGAEGSTILAARAAPAWWGQGDE